jgi:hypothetical protein
MLIAVGTELFQLNAPRRITTIFLSGVTGYTVGTLVRIGPALCAFQSNDEADAFSHDRSPRIFRLTQTTIIHKQGVNGNCLNLES